MKKLLVLAGGSLRNQAWGEEYVENFKDSFDEVYFPHYNHWETGEKNIDFATEIKKIAETVKQASAEGEWYIFAKSIGSVLALKAIGAGAITPTKCVFFGMPLNLVADSEGKDDWSSLAGFKIPALAFHNDEDPTALYEFTREKLAKYAPHIVLATLSGDTHDYLDTNQYKEEIMNFLYA